MSYEKQTWHDMPTQDTPVSSERLAHMEDGIEAATNLAAQALATAIAAGGYGGGGYGGGE